MEGRSCSGQPRALTLSCQAIAECYYPAMLNQYGDLKFNYSIDLPPEYMPVILVDEEFPYFAIPTDKVDLSKLGSSTDYYAIANATKYPYRNLLVRLVMTLLMCKIEDRNFNQSLNQPMKEALWGIRSDIVPDELKDFTRELEDTLDGLKDLELTFIALRAGIIQKHYWLSTLGIETLQSIFFTRKLFKHKLEIGLAIYERYYVNYPKELNRKARSLEAKLRHSLEPQPYVTWLTDKNESASEA
jgi:hypothetical protein